MPRQEWEQPGRLSRRCELFSCSLRSETSLIRLSDQRLRTVWPLVRPHQLIETSQFPLGY